MEKPVLYIDFDKTITPKHGFGEPPVREVKDALITLSKKFTIIIYSTRANSTVCHNSSNLELLEYLNKHNIPYDSVCETKPLFAGIIDDRSFNPHKESWGDILKQLMGQ